MTRADTLKEIADAYYKLADLFQNLASEAPGTSHPAVPAAGGPAPAPANDICPKHGQPYKDGNYGPYCTALTDDPAWANKRGYCTINPKNAPKWVQIHGAA